MFINVWKRKHAETKIFFSTAVKNSDECELYCVAKGYRFFRRLSPRLKDGTPCLSDLKKVCIGGTCKVCTTILTSSN